MAEQAEPKFVIQGVEYAVPSWESFTIDESELMYDRGKITLDQVDENTRMSPGIIAAMVMIAYMRGNPNVSRARAEKLIGGMRLADLVAHLVGDEDDDADVPPSVSETPGSPENTSSSTTTSGEDSGTVSEPPADPALPTGTLASVMQPTFDQETSAA